MQAMDPRVVMISDILKGPSKKYYARQLASDITNMGGKTGTTNDYKHVVFRLCIKYSRFAWVGKDDGTSLGDNEFGSTTALPIWLIL